MAVTSIVHRADSLHGYSLNNKSLFEKTVVMLTNSNRRLTIPHVLNAVNKSPKNDEEKNNIHTKFPQISDLFKSIKEVVSQLNKHIDSTIQKQGEEFLIAYKSEMLEIEKKLSDYNNLLSEKNLEMQKNEQIELYQKTIEWFKNESIRLSMLVNRQKDKIGVF